MKPLNPNLLIFFHQKQKGFSLVEVLVATIIFALAAAGLLATISALSKPAEVSTRSITAAMMGRRILEGLRKDVDASSWTDGPLKVGHYTNSILGDDNVNYIYDYEVMDDPAGTGARKVTINVLWNE